MIMEMAGNRNFTLTTGNGKRSRLWRLKNSVPKGSFLAPLPFNIYISDVPNTVSRKYAYVDVRGQDFCFYYGVCLEQTFLGTKKLGTLPLNAHMPMGQAESKSYIWIPENM